MQSVSEVRVLKHTCSVSVALLVMYMCYIHTCSNDLCDSNCKLLWLFQFVIGAGAVLRGGQGGHGPPVRTLAPLWPPLMKLVAR